MDLFAVCAAVLLLNNAAWLWFFHQREQSARKERYEWAERLQRPEVRPVALVEASNGEVELPEPDEYELVGTIQPDEPTDG